MRRVKVMDAGYDMRRGEAKGSRLGLLGTSWAKTEGFPGGHRKSLGQDEECRGESREKGRDPGGSM
jgi:hypothetical protein